MIPKVIHYCWFGRGELTQLARKCIASWRQIFPAYEIKEWNEDNFDVNIIPDRGPFMGFEILGTRSAVNPGLGLAAEPGMALYKAILEQYEQVSFFSGDGNFNPYTMIPMVTDLLKDRGLTGNGTIERIEGITIYPPDWFNPFDDATGRLRKTENTRTIHWFAKSWLPAEPTWKTAVKRFLRRFLGTERLSKIGQFLKKR